MFLSSDPEVWFIESSHGMVTKTIGEESTVPCLVTNPNIRVTLHDKDADLSIKGVYVPSEGFKAYLEYKTYVCRGELEGEVKESQSFNVYSIHGMAEEMLMRQSFYKQKRNIFTSFILVCALLTVLFLI